MLAAPTAAFSDRRVVRLIGSEPAENGGKSSECSRCKQDRSISIAEAVHGQSLEYCVRDGTGEPAGQVSGGNVSDQPNPLTPMR
jgi:hypothetical protein